LDNGNEFALHDVISRELSADVYFANPYSPWERGLNENTNGLIRMILFQGDRLYQNNRKRFVKNTGHVE